MFPQGSGCEGFPVVRRLGGIGRTTQTQEVSISRFKNLFNGTIDARIKLKKAVAERQMMLPTKPHNKTRQGIVRMMHFCSFCRANIASSSHNNASLYERVRSISTMVLKLVFIRIIRPINPSFECATSLAVLLPISPTRTTTRITGLRFIAFHGKHGSILFHWQRAESIT